MEQLTKENQEYIKTMSRLFEKEPAALLNNIIESHRKKNAEIYERARAAGEEASGNISIYKVIGAKAAPERIGKEPARIPDTPAAHPVRRSPRQAGKKPGRPLS